MSEGGFYDRLEQFFIAPEILPSVPAEPDHGGLDLGRRGKGAGSDRKEIFDIVPCLKQDGKDSIGFRPGLFRDPFGDFFLDHADHLRDPVLVVEDLEENLGRDVIGEIADDGEGPGHDPVQGKFQEISLVESSLHAREMGQQVIDRFPVDLDELQVEVLAGEQILRQDAHSGADLKDRHLLRGYGEGVDNRLRDRLIRQEMLPEGFFRSNLHTFTKIYVFFHYLAGK